MENREKMALSSQNYKLMVISAVIVLIGVLLMVGGGTDDPTQFNAEELFSFRRITLAPIVILSGFGFMVYAIMKRNKVEPKEEVETTPNKKTKQK